MMALLLESFALSPSPVDTHLYWIQTEHTLGRDYWSRDTLGVRSYQGWYRSPSEESKADHENTPQPLTE